MSTLLKGIQMTTTRKAIAKLQGLVAHFGSQLAEMTKLEILMPIVHPVVRANFSRLARFQEVITTFPDRLINDIYLQHAIECAEREISHLEKLPNRFLRSMDLVFRLEDILKVVQISRPTAAAELRESLRDYRNLVRWEQASVDEMAESFISLAGLATRIHREVIQEQVAAVLNPKPVAHSGKNRRYVDKGQNRGVVGKKGGDSRKRKSASKGSKQAAAVA